MNVNVQFFQQELMTSSDSEVESELSDKAPKQKFCCAVCHAEITDDRFKSEVNGRHLHTRINPTDNEFTFACFADALGCKLSGSPTQQDSWFNGCRWRYAHCKSCGTQIGWHFSGTENFFALILEQLVDCEAEASGE